jgi:hypothetical protein
MGAFDQLRSESFLICSPPPQTLIVMDMEL